jgi:nitroreductase
MKNEEIIEKLNWRYAVKKFDAVRKVSEADWQTLEESLMLTPTSFGLQPYKFIVITDDKLKAELQPFAWNQPQISTCSHLVVIATKNEVTEADVEEYIQRIMEVRGTDYNDDMKNFQTMINGFRKNAEDQGWMQQWTHKQSYIALGFLMQTAALLHIDSCPMEGFNAADFDRILGLDKEGYSAAVLCPVGYRSAEDWLANLPKVRFDSSKLVKHI